MFKMTSGGNGGDALTVPGGAGRMFCPLSDGESGTEESLVNPQTNMLTLFKSGGGGGGPDGAGGSSANGNPGGAAGATLNGSIPGNGQPGADSGSDSG